MKQQSFSDLSWSSKSKRTRRERFLCEMEEVIPWNELEKVIKPYAPQEHPGSRGGRRGYAVRVMLRIHFCQQWYSLSDDGMEDALYDSESLRRFCLKSSSHNEIPDERSIRRFRHLLEQHQLYDKLHQRVNRFLSEKKLFTKQGTIVDATLIHAPSSTKNKEKKRDPEMSQTRKGNQWYFGMKCHHGVDAASGIIHTVMSTTAKDSDISVLPALLHGEESEVLGDKAYCSEPDKLELAEKDVTLKTPLKKPRHRELTSREKNRNRKFSARRAIGEHPFHIIKNIFKYRKVRYRGIEKNRCQQVALAFLASIYIVRKKLLKESSYAAA